MAEHAETKPAKGRFWLDIFLPRKTTEKVPSQDLQGKVIVFTGDTDGMVASFFTKAFGDRPRHGWRTALDDTNVVRKMTGLS